MTITPNQVDQIVEITEGDTGRVLNDQLFLAGQTIDLTNATISLWWIDPTTDSRQQKTATVTSAVSGSVSYQLTADDVSEPGIALLQWNIEFSNGSKLRVPTGKFIKLNILPDLED